MAECSGHARVQARSCQARSGEVVRRRGPLRQGSTDLRHALRSHDEGRRFRKLSIGVKIDAIGAVEDGVGEHKKSKIVPPIDGNLAGDNERAFVVAILEISSRSRVRHGTADVVVKVLVWRQRLRSPII
jgi:hypothetical protein